jgi:hypothetical protein
MIDGLNRCRAVALLTLACAAGSVAAMPTQPAPAHMGETRAQPMDDPAAPPVRWLGAGVDTEAAIPSHPPIELIPPMPMSNLGNVPTPGAPMGVPLVHDSATGLLTEYPTYQASGLLSLTGPDFDGAFNAQSDGGVIEFEGGRSFGTLTIENNLTASPIRRNVKIVMRFVDINGIDRFFVASGSMADPETVLTAGHCVYAHSPNGITINDWAEEFWVYPGWDGNGPTNDNNAIIENFGIGYGTVAGAFTGWTVDENNDWDVGLIRVTRAVGSLTGWFGWSWGGSCSTLTGRTHYLYSYPAQSCSATLHNGRDMYRWAGTYDSCPGNQLEIDTTPGCFSEQHGGMSGGGSYYFDNGDRVVHAVVSNSLVNGETAWHTELWEGFVNFMQDFENTSRGSAFDVQILNANYSASSVVAGGSITGQGYVMANPTNADPGSIAFTVEHYLSTNPIISTGDTRIRTEGVTWDFAPVSTVNVNNSGSYIIPKDTPTGTYYLGPRVTYADASTVNNDASHWDAHEIFVDGFADVEALSVAVNGPPTHTAGESLSVDFSFTNSGGDPSSQVTVEIRLSTNTFISASDTLLGTFVYGGLSSGQTISQMRTVSIDQSVAAGNYYVGIIVSASDDEVSNNNTAVSGLLTVEQRSDLNVASIAVPDGVYDPDSDTLDIACSVANVGAGGSGVFTLTFYASTNDFISPSDIGLGSQVIGSLAGGQSFSSNFAASFPASIPDGSYFIGAIASAGNLENALVNNKNFDAVPITVERICDGDADGDNAVGTSDLLIVLANWGQSTAGGPANGDFDESGFVGTADLLILLGAWGTACN